MQQKIIDLTQNLISIPSDTNDINELRKISDFVAGLLHDFTIERFEKNNKPSLLIYNHEGKQTRDFKVILNAHLDVVPAHENQYVPRVEGNKLYGRGAFDMKGAAAVEILVFQELARELPYNLGLQLVTDEEHGGFDGTKHQIKNGVRAEFVIVGESGTDFNIKNIAKGIYWLKIKTRGVPAHGAYPWRGKNAVWKMYEFLTRLKEKYPETKEYIWKSTVNVAHMSTPNITYNIVPDECEVLLDIRYVPEDKDTILDEIRNLYEFDFEELWLNEPMHFTPEDNKYIQQLAKSIEKATGKKPNLVKSEGGSDMRHYTPIDVATVEFGPRGKNEHAEDEYVEIDSLVDYYKSLKQFLLDLKDK